jgi:hypothetical protein
LLHGNAPAGEQSVVRILEGHCARIAHSVR